MITKVFTIVEESYHRGELNDIKKLYFSTEDLRDDYFINVSRQLYIEQDWIETTENDFGIGDWSYHLEKGEEELVIINIKSW